VKSSEQTQFEEFLTNESRAWESVQQLRRDFSPKIFDNVKSMQKEEAVERAIEVFQNTMSVAHERGFTFDNVGPGHGLGHLIRDYANALTMLPEQEADPKHTFIGFLGGTLHDLGCALMPRYEESKRAVRHAEGGALFLLDLFNNNLKLGTLNDEEKIAVAYSVAAHTHYLKPSEVECQDGETRTILPYTDTFEDGSPIQAIWFTRWVDRLDCNGPSFLARHYLTLHEDHEEREGESHSIAGFGERMRPLFRTKEERDGDPLTSSELMKMFADSQTNDSPYGKHDSGKMVELRDKHRELFYNIIGAIKNPNSSDHQGRVLSFSDDLRKSWYSFLTENIEPSRIALEAASKLGDMFAELPSKTRIAWESGFQSTMENYAAWSFEKSTQIDGRPDPIYKIPGVTEDIRNIIEPRGNWILDAKITSTQASWDRA